MHDRYLKRNIKFLSTRFYVLCSYEEASSIQKSINRLECAALCSSVSILSRIYRYIAARFKASIACESECALIIRLFCYICYYSIAGSRETCDIEGDDVTVDKIPNTRCFHCICKVNLVHQKMLIDVYIYIYSVCVYFYLL